MVKNCEKPFVPYYKTAMIMNFQSNRKLLLQLPKCKPWILINTSFMLLFCMLSLSLHAQDTQNKDTTVNTHKEVSVAYGSRIKMRLPEPYQV